MRSCDYITLLNDAFVFCIMWEEENLNLILEVKKILIPMNLILFGSSSIQLIM